MKIKYLIYTFLLLWVISLSSCEEYLDKAPSSDLPESAVFSDARLFKEYVDGLYIYLWYSPADSWAAYSFGGFCSMQMSNIEDATDLSDGARNDAGPRASLNMGNWFAGQGVQAEVDWPWEGSYKAIRICNRILDNVDVVENLSDTERDEIKGQALFFRAFFHFQLLKRYGNVLYVDRTFNTDDDMDLPRDTYDDYVQKLCDDCDEAAALLPLEFPKSELGRPEKGAALAYKARTLLYAASPFNNPENDKGKWRKAAQAAYDVIALGKYSLVPNEEYRNIFYGRAYTSESIFLRNGGPGGYGNSQMSLPNWGSFELGVGARPWSTEWGATPCPTQNLMDRYETSDGQKIINNFENYDGVHPDFNTASGYSDENMYENRDPRMKYTFLLNGEPWLDAKDGIELFFHENGSPGTHIGEGVNWTRTGYLEKKFWDPALSPTTGSTYMNWNYIRYTDVIMIYAEAMNEAFGPDNDGLGTGLTSRAAVNQVRNRVEHVDVIASNQTEMRERIMNERAIEFVYEGQRWYDVIRWGKGVEYFNTPVYGIRTTKLADGSFKLERKKIMDRVFKDYMHRYPIPQSEINKSFNLKNNPGWSAEIE
jgi:hypothetical protein